MKDKMLNDILDSIIDNATAEDIQLIMEKLNHYFLNNEYETIVKNELVELSQDKSCPKCNSFKRINYGHDKKGNQRFRCSHCGKTYSTVTGSLLSYTKKEPYQWYIYLESLLNGETLKTAAAKTGICEETAFVWRHKICNVLKQLTDGDQMLSDIVYLDETFHDTTITPGTKRAQPVVKKRGISDQKRNIACAIDCHGNKIIQVSECGRIHSNKLINIFKNKISTTSTVVSDSQRSYHPLMKELGINWIKIPSGKTESNGYNLTKINQLHSSIQWFIEKYKGISDKYLISYISLYKYKSFNTSYYNPNVLRSLFKAIVNSQSLFLFKDFSYARINLNDFYQV